MTLYCSRHLLAEEPVEQVAVTVFGGEALCGECFAPIRDQRLAVLEESRRLAEAGVS